MKRMTKKNQKIFFLVVSILLAYFFEQRVFPEGDSDASAGFAAVDRVVDGDTIALASGETVRYIGIDTPETVKPNAPIECFGKEASEKNRALVSGKKIRMQKDISDTDRYGRLLRYVYLEDGTLVNEVLVREGYAFASSFPPDIAMQEVFREAERSAKQNKRGLWADGACARK